MRAVGTFFFLIGAMVLGLGLQTVARADFSSEQEFLVHSHNDFQQDHPLWDALRLGYRSLEADVVDRKNQVKISHIGILTQGTLKELYLDPLQKLVDRRGSVYGDGKTVYLWIEIRPIFTGRDIVPLLRDLLLKYPMLASFSKDGTVTRPGPVVAIICGYSGYKEKLFAKESGDFPACLAGTDFDVSQPKKDLGTDGRLKWVALRWGKYVDWDGEEPLTTQQRDVWKRLLDSLHAQGLRVRFFSNPQTETFWRIARELGVDQAGTNELGKIRTTVPDRYFSKGGSQMGIKWD